MTKITPEEEHDIWQDIRIRHGFEALASINAELVRLNPMDHNDKRRIKKLEIEKEKLNVVIEEAISASIEENLIGEKDE